MKLFRTLISPSHLHHLLLLLFPLKDRRVFHRAGRAPLRRGGDRVGQRGKGRGRIPAGCAPPPPFSPAACGTSQEHQSRGLGAQGLAQKESAVFKEKSRFLEFPPLFQLPAGHPFSVLCPRPSASPPGGAGRGSGDGGRPGLARPGVVYCRPTGFVPTPRAGLYN